MPHLCSLVLMVRLQALPRQLSAPAERHRLGASTVPGRWIAAMVVLLLLAGQGTGSDTRTSEPQYGDCSAAGLAESTPAGAPHTPHHWASAPLQLDHALLKPSADTAYECDVLDVCSTWFDGYRIRSGRRGANSQARTGRVGLVHRRIELAPSTARAPPNA